jgi:hypothetical protein
LGSSLLLNYHNHKFAADLKELGFATVAFLPICFRQLSEIITWSGRAEVKSIRNQRQILVPSLRSRASRLPLVNPISKSLGRGSSVLVFKAFISPFFIVHLSDSFDVRKTAYSPPKALKGQPNPGRAPK